MSQNSDHEEVGSKYDSFVWNEALDTLELIQSVNLQVQQFLECELKALFQTNLKNLENFLADFFVMFASLVHIVLKASFVLLIISTLVLKSVMNHD